MPKSILKKATGRASEPISFSTGGGIKNSYNSIGIQSDLVGNTEAFKLESSPFATSMGQTVMENKRPFIWHFNGLPWYCTDHTKLQIICPLKYRRYADRVDDHVPIFKEKISINPNVSKSAAPNFLTGAPATSELVGDNSPPGPAGSDSRGPEPLIKVAVDETIVDEQRTYQCVPCDDQDAIEDSTIGFRSMSIRELLKEAATPLHQASHYPHNPMCETCKLAHMRQQSYAHKKDRVDDGLPPLTEPLQQLGVDVLIISKSGTDETRISSSDCIVLMTIRDQYSGQGFTIALPNRTQDAMLQGTMRWPKIRLLIRLCFAT